MLHLVTILSTVGICFQSAAVLRQDNKTTDKDVWKMISERLVHNIILFRAECSCGVPGKTSLSGSRCTVDSKPQRLPFPPSLRPSSSSSRSFIPTSSLPALPFQSSACILPCHFNPPHRVLHGLLPIFPFVSVHPPNAPAWGEWLLLIPCQSDPNWATA